MKNTHTNTNLITPPKKTMKRGKAVRHIYGKAPKYLDFGNPVQLQLTRKPSFLILGSKVVTTYSSSARAKGAENAEDRPPIPKMRGLSGKCSKL